MRLIVAFVVACCSVRGQEVPAPRPAAPASAVVSPPDRRTQYDQMLTTVRQFLRDKKFQEAASLSERAVQTDDTRWEAYVTGASAYSGMGMYDDAIGLLQMALPRAPQDRKPEVRTALQECRAALANGAPPAAATPQSRPAPATAAPPPTAPMPVASPQPSAATLTQAEIVLWKSIENSNRPEDYQGYLNSYPNGVYSGLASSRIEAIAWKGIENSENQDDLRAFLSSYPNGPHAATTSARLQKIRWNTIEKSSNPTDFRRFLAEFPNSSYVAMASNRLEELDWLPVVKSTRSEEVKAYIDSHPGGTYLPGAKKLYAELVKLEEDRGIKEQEDKAREAERMRNGWTFSWAHVNDGFGVYTEPGKMTIGPQGIAWEEEPTSNHNFTASCSEVKYVENVRGYSFDIYVGRKRRAFLAKHPGRAEFLKGFPHFCGGPQAN